MSQGRQPSWPQGEDFVFSIHPNSNQQLELTVLQASRLSFSKHSESANTYEILPVMMTP